MENQTDSKDPNFNIDEYIDKTGLYELYKIVREIHKEVTQFYKGIIRPTDLIDLYIRDVVEIDPYRFQTKDGLMFLVENVPSYIITPIGCIKFIAGKSTDYPYSNDVITNILFKKYDCRLNSLKKYKETDIDSYCRLNYIPEFLHQNEYTTEKYKLYENNCEDIKEENINQFYGQNVHIKGRFSGCSLLYEITKYKGSNLPKSSLKIGDRLNSKMCDTLWVYMTDKYNKNL